MTSWAAAQRASCARHDLAIRLPDIEVEVE
jgi:hypothetical protein